MGGEEDSPSAATRRPCYWRSQSWSASRSSASTESASASQLQGSRRLAGTVPVLTPRAHQNCKARSSLPPLQPLAIARRSVDEWPRAGSDDVGEWAPPLTPSHDLKVDLSVLRPAAEGRRLFDKECSKVAEHIYLGGDAVARDREILRKHGITHVLNCVGFVCPEYFKSDLVYRTLWLQDSPSEDITSILYDVFDYFEDVRGHRGRVLVHCCQGVSRSTSLVIAYLMWREGQSFEDAFGFVKAARGIANPNMGFACQLLQCQKRVLAFPLSPNSLLRMFRMAPHSPYDALHLVPKMLGEPSPSALDSRGAFIVHVPSSIYVWIGRKCEPVMKKDARAAAHQVVRYEKVRGPIIVAEEGREPPEFWEAFAGPTLIPALNSKIQKKKKDRGANPSSVDSNPPPGKRTVEAYDTDFEIFYKGLCGGILPSSAGAGHETHIPSRESSWSILRWKFVSTTSPKLTISRTYSEPMFTKDGDVRVDGVRLNLSPSCLSSDSSNSSKCSLDSPGAPPPGTCTLDNNVPSSKSESSTKFSLKAILSPSKRFGRSLAERRGGFSPSLKLSTSVKGDESANLKNAKRESVGNGGCDCSDKGRDPSKRLDSRENWSGFGSGLAGNKSSFPLAYGWPDCKKIEPLSRDVLDSLAAFLVVVREDGFSFTGNLKAYMWIGSCNSCYVHASECREENGSITTARDAQYADWNQVGRDILKSVGLPLDVPVKVVREEDSEEFLDSIFVDKEK